MDEITGKTAIITGASRGIGAATALMMAQRGANIILAARSKAEIEELADNIRTDGGKACAFACDVSDHTSVQALVDFTVEKFGSVDILVNNAGVLEPIASLGDAQPEAWGKVIDINVKGVYHGTRSVLPYMEKQGNGVIVNISSGAATNALEGWSAYCASKAAALMLTKATHAEYANKGIRVVGLSPGTVATEMQVIIKASGINPVSQLDPSVHIPPEWVAKTICWLCTNDAKEYDGGDVSLRDEMIKRRAGVN